VIDSALDHDDGSFPIGLLIFLSSASHVDSYFLYRIPSW